MTNIDHFEALFDKKYLRWFHLNGKPCKVTIERVEKDVEMTLPGGKVEKKPVVYFVGKEKPLVLNPTNAKLIADICGPKPSEWTGKTITLYQSSTQMYDKELKKMVERECIRIR